ncbi:M24 family metallopeptidase [Pararhizobium mangrovi]|uniref:M24 family metallopeptidase n=1 Tax=Pararhizobium mangrovi TaxID=2590452 RepID=A0A506U530_9HYPH|nr:M24 family metallopeptidase [Pararhizobium mangrovi]TPW28184.1 M24 family metallopeptidase [Pararhizobium mangrovi]
MAIVLKPVALPHFGVPIRAPEIPQEIYAERCDTLYARSGADWVVVYADREHLANIAFLSAFEPRFEEALLLLGPDGRRILVCGNESSSYAPLARLPETEIVLCQSLSLMGQTRESAPALEIVLEEVGLKAGDTFGVVGWKYLGRTEWSGEAPSFQVSAHLIDVLRKIAGKDGSLVEATPILMDPEKGLRAVVDVHQIAAGEWGAARASEAVWRIVTGISPGEDEFTAAARMGYAGEELSAHVMFATAAKGEPVVGLRSPRGRILSEGEGVSTAVSYWGGLSSRAGMIAREDDDFVEIAKSYFGALLTWYETVDLGCEGGEVDAAVRAKLAEAKLEPALNPGHLVGHDEWMNTPIVPGGRTPLVSGMPFQVDIIPTPMSAGKALNCEDAVTLADEALRDDLRTHYPETADRIEARRRFLAEELGVSLKDCILPLSNTPLCLPPLWLRSNMLLAKD